MPFATLTVPDVLRRPGVQRAVKAVLALAAMGYLVYFVEPAEIAVAVAEMRPGYALAALALLPVNVLLEGDVWRRILTTVVPGASYRKVYGAVMSGFSLGLFTPARTGEFAARALYFGRGDRWAIAATVFVQRLLDMLAGVGVGTAALAWLLRAERVGGSPAWQGALAVGMGVSLALTLLLLFPHRATRPLRRWISSEKVLRRLAFLEDLGPARMADAFGRALLRFLVYSAQFVLFLRAFGAGAPGTVLFAGVAVVFFVKFLFPSLTLMDVGVREGAAVLLLSQQLGAPEAASFNAAFFLFLTNLVLPAALGVPFLMRMRLSKTEDAPEPPGGAASSGKEEEQQPAPISDVPAEKGAPAKEHVGPRH